MGCDIHCYAEKIQSQDEWSKTWVCIDSGAFDMRSYGIFGFLANVRNYSEIPPISEPRDLPSDVSNEVWAEWHRHWELDGHSKSWLSLKELNDFNYDAQTEDRHVTRQTGPNSWNGGCTCEPGEGEKTTFREFLGEGYFDELKRLTDLGAERIVFWFDN